MEKDKMKTSRASQTRAKAETKKVWTPPNSLDAPPAPTGYRHQWLRSEILGQMDTKNIASSLREGWELVRADEYYAEVDKRIRLEFPLKFDKVEDTTTERAKPAQTVASAKRSASTSKGRKTVKLTPSQVAIAKRLGVPLEEYAKQLNITEGV